MTQFYLEVQKYIGSEEECIICRGDVTELDVMEGELLEKDKLCENHIVRCFTPEYTTPINELCGDE